METDLQAIRDVVNDAELSAEMRRTVLWGLDQLAPLYRQLEQTYDVRYSDNILRLVQGMLKTLTGKEADSPDAPKVAEAIVLHLREMHQRHGIANLGLKLPAPPKTSHKRKKV